MLAVLISYRTAALNFFKQGRTLQFRLDLIVDLREHLQEQRIDLFRFLGNSTSWCNNLAGLHNHEDT